MTRKILILSMLFAMTFLMLPLDSFAQRRGRDRDRSYREYSSYSQDRWENRGRRRRWRNRNRETYGYRNYGQYRRTQVGNRRYRMVRRYYWNDGSRLSRWVRVYY